MFGDDPTSRYEIWIDKRTNLPFKYHRDMAQGTFCPITLKGETFMAKHLNPLEKEFLIR